MIVPSRSMNNTFFIWSFLLPIERTLNLLEFAERSDQPLIFVRRSDRDSQTTFARIDIASVADDDLFVHQKAV